MINNNAVKIAVRERPARNHLESKFDYSVINYHPNGNNVIVNDAVFTFDYVLGPSVTQKEIFDKLIKPLVVNLKLGFNCTALAYGQTGAGKSYTMGLNSKSFDGDDVGVIPRCLNEIFSMIEMDTENQENNENFITSSRKIEISVSFIEIYNEKVYDLLGENVSDPIVARGYKYTGGTRKPLNNLQDCYAILMQGNKNRHVRPTKMNLQSSRSHAIFTIHVCSRTQNVNGDEVETTSCMNIVDLAGSEGVRRTGHQGMAMSEGVHINQGLLSIGKVLQAMTTGSKVIPYRDSVLSSVLQAHNLHITALGITALDIHYCRKSLNSNSYLTLLACVSPHREDLSETLSTLRFAQNAKQLKNAPEINNNIKKQMKLKQTPKKVKPMQINNNRARTPMKRSYSTLCGLQTNSSIKSNTFCTPKKKKFEVNKCNQTQISSDCKRPKLSNAAMNIPKMDKFESTLNRESLFSKSIDSNGSLLSLNISTSTTLDGHTSKRTSNFSPIIRKCMAEFKNDLEDNILQMLQKNLHMLVPQTAARAATPANANVLSSTMRQELKTIVKEVLYEKRVNTEEVKQNLQNNSINTKCQLFNSSDDVFKIPEIPLQIKTPSPLSKNQDCAIATESLSQTFSGILNSNKKELNKSIRRSCRISEKQPQDHSTSANDSVLAHANHSLRRSSRKSVLQLNQAKRRSVRLAARNESFQMKNGKENTNNFNNAGKKVRKTKSINNSVIDGYCNESTSTTTKTSLTKHRKAVLDLLNTGSMKHLQILPQIGQKTAYLIVTQRTLSGKFKNWSQVEKLPIWRGSAWERFAQANMLI